jgi:membrane protease YdiL (CAAX protease family)
VLALWQRMPVIVRAVLAGGTLSVVGVVVWSFFSKANQRVLVTVPWAIVPTAVFLWVFWRWARGDWSPASTSEARRSSLRAHALSPDVFGMAIFAGILGFASLIPFLGVLSRLVTLNPSAPIRVPPEMPFGTVVVLLIMASVVAGVVEEAAFRGYIQGPIERRHGPVVAIVVVGALFGLGHFTHHPESVLQAMPYYLAVSAIYGMLAYLTNSILPGLALHVVGDVLVLNRLWMTGRAEWELTATPPTLLWESGPDAAFWGSIGAFIVLGAAAVWAFVGLASAARGERAA